MKSNKRKEQRKKRIDQRFISSVPIVNYSHSPNYGPKYQGSKHNKQNKKEKRLGILQEIGLPVAALLVSLGTLWYVIVQTDISEQAMRISNRPYVGIEKVAIANFLIRLPFSISVSIKNAGQTPAYSTYVTLKTERIAKSTKHQMPEFKREDKLPNQYFIPSGTSQELAAIGWTVLPDSIQARISYGELELFVHGIIEYNDVFGDRHFTEFGFKYDPEFSTMEPCENHNNAN